MKYISRHSDRLQEARDRIVELEAENKRLREENSLLRTRTTRGTTRSTPVPSPVTTERPHFAAPTASSRLKEKNALLPKEQPRKVIRVDGKPYIYTDGVPTFCGTPVNAQPHYMEETKALRYRSWEKMDERLARDLLKKKYRACHKPQTPGWQNESDSGYDSPSGGPESLVEQDWEFLEPSFKQSSQGFALSPWLFERESDKMLGLADRTRLDDSLDEIISPILTNSKTNLDYLRKAAKIVQTTMWNAWKNGMGYSRADFADGPHLIGLGRNELLHWVDRYTGIGAKAFDSMMEVVELRNVMSHPHGSELRSAYYIEEYLRRAQKVCIKLEDEGGALEVRKLRDALHADVQDTLQSITEWHHLVTLSCSEALNIETHHMKMFERVMDHWEFWENRQSEELEAYQALYEVAQAWANQRDE